MACKVRFFTSGWRGGGDGRGDGEMQAVERMDGEMGRCSEWDDIIYTRCISIAVETGIWYL
jgi:hypothetical protein